MLTESTQTGDTSQLCERLRGLLAESGEREAVVAWLTEEERKARQAGHISQSALFGWAAARIKDGAHLPPAVDSQ